MQKTYYAKSTLANGRQPTVKEHLTNVSALARQYGGELSMADAAELAGKLHDFGKYGDLFQKLLQRKVERINHAAGGAALLWMMSKRKSIPEGLIPIAEAVLGHHDGLASYWINEEALRQSVRSDEHFEIDGKQLALAGETEFSAAIQQFKNDFPDVHLHRGQMLPLPEDKGDRLAAMLTTRMLFSCLVDADYSVSAADEDEQFFEHSEDDRFSPEDALDALQKHLAEIRDNSTAETELNRIRDEIFAACGESGELEPGVFNLTAPTGVGKTLALLHFALRHCKAWGKRRIILVLPFLSLTEQSAKTYRNILPNLLEDTSQSGLDDAGRLFASRWRTPFIVTTSVRFFESLFADRPTDCRKLHNIANSVIVFDEAQSLPPELTRATIRATDELCGRYGCTMVFSTATQPDYSAIPEFRNRAPREILPDYASYYPKLKRTEVEWRLKPRVSWKVLSEELAEQDSVCAIVNLRRHARALYRLLSEQCGKDEVFYLTTDLCPAHRSAVIERIKERLERGLPCRVVSTQCIEAGVDLDFGAVYRALAPLDSIIQAAGRCNRNGKSATPGRVVVFVPEDEAYPGTWYQNCAETVDRLVCEAPIDIHDPKQISRYYRDIFRRLGDKSSLREAIDRKDYREVARVYKLIEKRGAQVVVPFIGQEALYNRICKEVGENGVTPRLMKDAASITVSCMDDRLAQFAEQLPYAGRRGEDGMSPFYLLRAQHKKLYLDDMGLQLPEDTDCTLFC